MKLLLPLILFLSLVQIANAQDTSRRHLPKYYRPSIIDLLHPDYESISRIHKERDSAYNAMYPEHHHPTLYADFGFGGSFFGEHGIEGNYSLNYQYKRSLFTFRGVWLAGYENSPYDVFTLFPDQITNSLGQFAFMYGWRFYVVPKQAYSFSIGISRDDRTIYYDYYDQRRSIETVYPGIPFEANYQLFTRRFGVNFGFKLFGDVSQHSFLGFGVNMGLGFHNSH